jgi:hypothetical protein
MIKRRDFLTSLFETELLCDSEPFTRKSDVHMVRRVLKSLVHYSFHKNAVLDLIIRIAFTPWLSVSLRVTWNVTLPSVPNLPTALLFSFWYCCSDAFPISHVPRISSCNRVCHHNNGSEVCIWNGDVKCSKNDTKYTVLYTKFLTLQIIKHVLLVVLSESPRLRIAVSGSV